MNAGIFGSYFTQKNGRLTEWKRKWEAFSAIVAGKPVIYGQPLELKGENVRLDGMYLVDSPVTIYTECKGTDFDNDNCRDCRRCKDQITEE